MAEAKTPGGLAERIKRARAAGVLLGRATDQLNGALIDAQKTIAGLNLGVTASVPLSSQENGPWSKYLMFERYRGEWCLTVNVYDELSEETTTTLLMESSRETRLEAADLLPALVDKLMDETEKQINTVLTKAEGVVAFCKHLREAQS